MVFRVALPLYSSFYLLILSLMSASNAFQSEYSKLQLVQVFLNGVTFLFLYLLKKVSKVEWPAAAVLCLSLGLP
jgi:hypothetical protein